MKYKISISTFFNYKKLAIFFVLNIIVLPIYAKNYFHTARENQNYRFINSDFASISINKKTRNYIFSTSQASVQFINKDLVEIRLVGRTGFHFFIFNLSDKQKLTLRDYKLQPYRLYSSNCSLSHGSDAIIKNKSLKEEYSNLSDRIEQVALSESIINTESCSQLSSEYQPQDVQKMFLFQQLDFQSSDLIKCVDRELSQQRIKGKEVEKVFDQMYANFNQILSGIKDNKNRIKINCSKDDGEKAHIKLSENQDLISINFKLVKTPNDFVKAFNHELIHSSVAKTNMVDDNTESDHYKTVEEIECLCELTTKSKAQKDCVLKETLSSSSKGVGTQQTEVNRLDSVAQEIQNSPAVQNFQPAPDSAVATLANETLRTPAATAVAQGYNGPILQQPSFDNAARAVVNSFTPLVNTLAASITRLEAQTPAGAATTGSSVGSSNEKTSSSKTSSAGAVAPSAVSASATTSVLTNSTGAALATGLQVAAKPIKESASEVATRPSSETATTVNSKMRSGETASTSSGAVAGVSSSSGRGVDAGSAASSAAAGGGQVSLVRQPANEANTFTPARAVITLNTLDTVKGNMYKATKEYYSNDNFKEGLRINGIQIQDGAQVLGATQKPKKIFIDDGQSLTKQKK